MKNRTGTFFAVLAASIIFFVYHRWFFPGVLGAPDFIQLSSERLGNFKWLPGAWSTVVGNGFGGSTFPQLNLDLYVHFFIRLFVFGFAIPWSWAQKIMFFWPFLVLGGFSSYYFVFGILKRPAYAILGSVIYLTNTYILMISGGGQVGLMMAYSLAPLVFSSFLRKNPFIFVCSSIFFILFDIRYAYLLYASLVLYVLIMVRPKEWLTLVKQFFPALIWIVAAHLYWIIPLMKSPSFGLPAGYDSAGWLTYLSWADFSKTISLLHPNWPENIFGKTYFMRPEFLILPVLSFVPFLTSKRQEGERIFRFFCLLLLMGAFLSKGVNPPFGQIYEWLFLHVPLFNVFRDPTKFYLLGAVAYAVTIPYALLWIEQTLSVFAKRRIPQVIVPLLFLLLWAGYLAPVWKGELRGTFTTYYISSDYRQFEQRASGGIFSRTLAVPWRHRFLFESELHPIINSSDLFGTSDMEKIMSGISDPSFERKIRMSGVRYIVVPEDKEGEVFLTDRVYDDALRQKYISVLTSLPYLLRVPEFSNLVVFEYGKPAGHFFRELDNLDVENQPDIMTRPSRYTVTVKTQERPTTIIFSEAYDPSWQLWDGMKYIGSERTQEGWNSFRLDSNNSSRIEIINTKENILTFSYGLSAFSVLTLVGIYLVRKRGKSILLIGVGIVVFGGILVVGQNTRREKNLISHPNIWKSSEWKTLSIPGQSSDLLSARFGGSIMAFTLRNATHLTFRVEGDNPVPGEQSLDISVGNTRLMLESPFQSVFRIPIPKGNSDIGVPVSITLHCTSAMIPCNVRLTGIMTDGVVERASIREQSLPVIAIFGDSISTSFGTDNYGYILANLLGYRLHNASVFGSSVVSVPGWDAASLRVHTDITEFHPDIALIVLGTNDLGRQISLDRFETAYSRMIADIQSGSPNAVVIATGLFPRKDFSEREIKTYNTIIERVARTRDIQYIDPSGVLTFADLSDPVHPKKESQTKIAEGLYARLKSAIPTRD